MEIGREDKLDQLGRILESRSMHGSENLKSFLKFVVDKSLGDGADQLKEYTIATEVFGRSNHFSPRNDSVVRVQASRLRSKLHEYYATEGKADPVRIELPKGHYSPVFSVIDREQEEAPGIPNPVQESNGGIAATTALTTASEISRTRKERRWLLAAAGVTLLVVVVMLIVFRDRGPGPVWEPFLRTGDQTLLVLSNPPVYRFTNSRDPDALIRDSITLTPGQIKRIEELLGDKFMIRNSPGQIILSKEQFTGMGEAIGLYCITDLFRSVGHGVLLKQSRTVSAEDLKNHNVILLGSVWVNEWSGKLPIKEDFSYTRNATIENRNPQPGEEQEYSPRFDLAGGLIEDYALITVKPNISGKNTVMILAGIHSEGTQAAAEYVAIPEYMNNLNQRLVQFSGKYYQALLKVAVDNSMPTTISLLSVHELHAPAE